MPPDDEPTGSQDGEAPPDDTPESVPGFTRSAAEPAWPAPGLSERPGPSGPVEATEDTVAAPQPGEEKTGRKRRGRKAKECGPITRPGGEIKANGSVWCAIREVVVILVIAALVAIFIQSFILKGFVIPSGSMEQTLDVGDRVFAEKVTYYFRKPKRGDVIVFRYPPSDPNALNTTNPFHWPIQQTLETFHIGYKGTTPYVKRVVATEGETLELRKGKLYINGKRINESYIVPDNADFGPVVVPEGMCYGFGDNRPNSRDSRFFGPIPYRSIIGRVFLIWWPFSHFSRPKGKPSG